MNVSILSSNDLNLIPFRPGCQDHIHFIWSHRIFQSATGRVLYFFNCRMLKFWNEYFRRSIYQYYPNQNIWTYSDDLQCCPNTPSCISGKAASGEGKLIFVIACRAKCCVTSFAIQTPHKPLRGFLAADARIARPTRGNAGYNPECSYHCRYSLSQAFYKPKFMKSVSRF